MAEDAQTESVDAGMRRFRSLQEEAAALGFFIGLIPGKRYVWVATSEEPDGGLQLTRRLTVLPWGTGGRVTGLTVRVVRPHATASFWGPIERGRADLSAARERLEGLCAPATRPLLADGKARR